jgi:hypothetical protein
VAQAVARDAEGLVRPVEAALHAREAAEAAADVGSGSGASGAPSVPSRPAIDIPVAPTSPLAPAPPPPDHPQGLGQVGGDPYLPSTRSPLEHAEKPGVSADVPTADAPAPERPPF